MGLAAQKGGRAATLRRLTRGLAMMVRVARALRPYTGGAGPGFSLAAALSVLYLVFRMAQPWPLKWIIDGLTSHHRHHPPAGFATLSLAYVVIAAAGGLTDYWQRRVVAGLANLVIFRFRASLFSHLLGLPLAYQERRGAGELLTRVVWDTARIRRGVSGVLLRMYQSVFVFAATVAVLAWISPVLAGVMLACGTVALMTMLTTNRRIVDAARVSRRREGRLASVVEEGLRGARDLQTFRVTRDPRFDQQNDRSLRGEQKLVRLEAGLLLRVEVVMAVSVCLILWLGAKSVAAGTLTAGYLVLFIHYTLALYHPLTQFARQSSQAGRTAACAERLVKIAERRTAVADGTVAAPPLAGEIVFEHVRLKASQRARGGRLWLLNGVSFRIAPGERVAIMGANGAGKSTLFSMILRLQDPESGRVLLDGRDVREYRLDWLRGQFSVLHQGATLFGLTVRENVALGRADASDAEVLEAIERAGAGDFIRRLPKGLDTVVRGARIFSAGERQRLALARAILRGGRLWLLDEPATALDAPLQLDSGPLAHEQGKTMLWITHDLAPALRMDRIIVLAHGKMTFSGTPSELKAFLASEASGQRLETGAPALPLGARRRRWPREP